MGRKFALVRAALFLAAAITGFGGVGFSSTAQAQLVTYSYVGPQLNNLIFESDPGPLGCPGSVGNITATLIVSVGSGIIASGTINFAGGSGSIQTGVVSIGSNGEIVSASFGADIANSSLGGGGVGANVEYNHPSPPYYDFGGIILSPGID